MKVLVVDDDEKIVKVLVTYLTKEGYMTETAMNGRSAVEKAMKWQPDIILLDVMLPELDGWAVCKEIRRNSDVPIIMLTARDDENDQVIGLELGADDYVTKPFSPRELIARIRAILRRVKPEVRRDKDEKVLIVGEITFYPHNHTLTVEGNPVELTPTEHKLLELFLTHPDQVLSRLQLIDSVQGYAFEGYERTVDSHIKNLRKKIGDCYGEPRYIKTVYGMGYKLAGDHHG